MLKNALTPRCRRIYLDRSVFQTKNNDAAHPLAMPQPQTARHTMWHLYSIRRLTRIHKLR